MQRRGRCRKESLRLKASDRLGVSVASLVRWEGNPGGLTLRKRPLEALTRFQAGLLGLADD